MKELLYDISNPNGFAKACRGGRIVWVGRSYFTSWLQRQFSGIVVDAKSDEDGNMLFSVEVTKAEPPEMWDPPQNIGIFTRAKPAKTMFASPGSVLSLTEPDNNIFITIS